MYRRPKFLEIIDEIRQEMSREADYDVDLFAEMIRHGQSKAQMINNNKVYSLQTLVFDELPKIEKQKSKTKG